MKTITWKTERRKISKLTGAEYNPRQLTEKQAKDLGESLERFNLADPIIINTNDTIIGGHQRINILRNRGVEEVDVRVPSRTLTEEEERELNLRLNKNLGEWDFDKLAEFDPNMLLTAGFTEEEIAFSFEIEPEDKDEEIPETPIEPKTKKGDLYKLGEHRLLCGDSTNVDDFERLMDGLKADMVFTDPPYGINYQDTKKKHRKIEGDQDLAGVQDLLVNVLNLNSCPIYICCNWKSFSTFEKIMIDSNKEPKSCIVWDKETRIQNLDKFYKQHEFILYHGLFGGQKTLDGDVWRISREVRKDHPTAKPIELIARAINYTVMPNQIVQDLFLGSGSTLIACEKTNRICYGMELDPKYCDVIIKRWEDYTGSKAVLIKQEEGGNYGKNTIKRKGRAGKKEGGSEKRSTKKTTKKESNKK